MPTPLIVVGGLPDLQQTAAEWTQRVPNDGPGLFLVPTADAAQRWNAMLGSKVAVMALEPFARTLVPSSLVSPPFALRTLIHAALPQDLAEAIYPRPLPGLHLNAIDTILECRNVGISPTALAVEDTFWQPLGEFIDQFMPESMVDAYRLYAYATAALLTTDLPYRVLFMDQLTLMPGAGTGFLMALVARVATTMTVESRPGLESILEPWRRLRPQWRISRRLPEMGAVSVVSGAKEDLAAVAEDALADLSWQGTVDILDDDTGYGQDLLRRRGMVLPRPAGLGEPWRRFWRVSQRQASRTDMIRWLSEMGSPPDAQDRERWWRQGSAWAKELRSKEPAVNWAENWGARVSRVHTLHGLADLVEEALTPYSVDDAVRAEIASWRAIDPSRVAMTETLAETLVLGLSQLPRRTANLSPTEQPPSPDWQLVPPLLAAARPSEGMVLWFGGPPDRSMEDTVGILLPPEVRRTWGLFRTQARLTQFVVNQAAYRIPNSLYVVARSELARFKRTLPSIAAVMAETERPQFILGDRRKTTPFSAETWYQAHRDGTEWSAFNGLLEPHAEALTATPSDMERYGACPLAYYFRRGLAVGEPNDRDDVAYPSRSLIGQWAHRILDLCSRQLTREGLTAPKHIQATVERLAQEVVKEMPPSSNVSLIAFQTAVDILVGELSQAIYVHRDLWESGVGVHTEQVLEWEFGGVAWHGRVDRYDAHDGQAQLYDYKTGHIDDPTAIRPDNLQLALYREGLAQHLQLPRSNIGASLVGVSMANQFRRRQLGPTPDLEAMVSKLAHYVTQGRFHPLPLASEAPCRSCAYRRVCPDQIGEEARRLWQHDKTDMRAVWMTDDEDDGGGSGESDEGGDSSDHDQ